MTAITFLVCLMYLWCSHHSWSVSYLLCFTTAYLSQLYFHSFDDTSCQAYSDLTFRYISHVFVICDIMFIYHIILHLLVYHQFTFHHLFITWFCTSWLVISSSCPPFLACTIVLLWPFRCAVWPFVALLQYKAWSGNDLRFVTRPSVVLPSWNGQRRRRSGPRTFYQESPHRSRCCRQPPVTLPRYEASPSDPLDSAVTGALNSLFPGDTVNSHMTGDTLAPAAPPHDYHGHYSFGTNAAHSSERCLIMCYETGISPSHFILRKYLQDSFSSGSSSPCVCLCFRDIYCTSSLSTLCTSYFKDVYVCHIIRSQVERQSRPHPSFRHQNITSRSKEVVGYCRHSTSDQFAHPSENCWCYSIYCLLCLFATSPTKHVSLIISCISTHRGNYYLFPSQ